MLNDNNLDKQQMDDEQINGEQPKDAQSNGEQTNNIQTNGEQPNGEQPNGEQPNGEQPLVQAKRREPGDAPAAVRPDPIEADPFARRRTRGNRVKRKRTPLTIFFDVLIAVIALVGLYLIVKPMVANWQQDKMTEQLDDAYLSGDGIIEIDPDAWPVEGEELEYAQLDTTESATQPTSTEDTDTGDESDLSSSDDNTGTVKIQAIGRIEIDRIDLNMPIASRSTVHDLRVAIGHYSPSAAFGESGLTVLLGHRMYTRGRHFNRLDEVKLDDEIIISDQTHRYTYVVDDIQIVDPEDMLDQLRRLQHDEPRLMLVTCHPVRVASHRLLVYAHLAEVVPLS